MKRFFSLILCLVFALTLVPGVLAAETEDGYTAIRSREELAAIGEDPGGRYRLMADIDLSGEDWSPIPFSGVLDGGGYTIYNMRVTAPGQETAVSVDGNNKQYDTLYAGLFSTLENAEIRDLHILGGDIAVETGSHCFAGLLTGYMDNTVISGCSVSGRVSLTASNVMVGVGGIAGFGSGELRDCEADAELIFTDRSEGIRCEQFMGGILACGNADITGCSVTVDGYDSCRGYVHNGGLVGMYYRYDERPIGSITGCSVSGRIRFFENNPDRRAYCEAFGGELLSYPAAMTDNTQSFTRDEVFDYSTELYPETCEVPDYTETVQEPGCENWGYTVHVCSGCGYEYRTDYVPPLHEPGDWETVTDATYTEPGLEQRRCTLCGAVVEERVINPHVEGEWQTVTEPDYGVPGLRQLLCADCGRVLREEELPPLIPAESVSLSRDALELHYKDSAALTAELLPGDAYDTSVVWSTSDEEVAVVDESGHVTAVGRGEAVITCRSADGFAEGSCPVSVGFSFGQWLIEILLFGWIWY